MPTTIAIARTRQLRRALADFVCLAAAAGRAIHAQQDIGHKLLGGVGIDAGVQSAPGLYISSRVVRYGASEVRDRNGAVVPLDGLDLDAWGGTLGAAFVLKPAAKRAPYFSFALSAPIAKLSLTVDDPRVEIDRSGFGDIYLLPLKAGWRLRGFDLVSSYSVYAPTGRFEPRGGSGIGRGFWTQELSLGGAAFLKGNRSRRISALASYDINSRKRGIDITRGNTLQIQGGAGLPVARVVTIGAAAYALWQVSADHGTALPAILRGQRDRVFGLGPEVQLALPKMGLRLEARAEFDFGVRSRPDGGVAAAGVTYRPDWF
jgi:hypothetical protein